LGTGGRALREVFAVEAGLAAVEVFAALFAVEAAFAAAEALYLSV